MKNLNIHVRAVLYTLGFLLAMAVISAIALFAIEFFGIKLFVGVFFAWCLYMMYEVQLSYLKYKEKLDEIQEKMKK